MVRILSIAFALLVAAACTSSSPSHPEAPASSSGSVEAADATTAQLTVVDFGGVWAEYWAIEGVADTQRYFFADDGRFGWLAPERTTPPVEPIQRSGTFRVETIEGRPVLTLDVSSERFSGCTGACAQAGEPRVVTHAPPLVIRYEIDACPANQEAEHLDQAYVCRSFGGQAFWRRAKADGIDTDAFFR
jgi:hypothetical protein